MNYIYRVIIFLVLVVLLIGCGGNDTNNKNKPEVNSKEYSSSQSCFADTRSIFKNINAPVFESNSTTYIHEGKKNVFTIVATSPNSATISYIICGRGSAFFNIDSNGKITFKGTSVYGTRSSYKITVKATDSNGKSDSQIFTINILEGVVPNIQNIEDQTFILANAIAPIEFVNTGGAITNCSATPRLPNGLGLSSATGDCVLSGTPTISSSAEYNITASNLIGEDNATINITTYQLAPNISDTMLSSIFPTEKVGLSHIEGLLSESWEFTNTGGAITKCDINQTIPDGLNLESNCTITGTPTRAGLDWYTITGSNSEDKNDTLVIQIQIKQNGLSIDSILLNPELTVGIEMDPIQFGPDDILYCGISLESPKLPSGLTLLANKTDKTCKITGTPTKAQVGIEYTIRATNALEGGGSATVTIVVNPSPPSIADIITDKSLTTGIKITPIIFTNTGGILTSCSSTSLPTGLNVVPNGNTCEINGIPSVAITLREYNITATNLGGEDNASINIAIVNPSPPNIADITTTNDLTVGIEITPIMFTNIGGIPTSCSSTPLLPTGLDIDTNGATCEINGTAPSDAIELKEYNITATNSGGEDNASINIAIVP